MSIKEMKNLYDKAHTAGMKALHSAVPTPMVVGEETFPFSGEIDLTKRLYHLPEGPCGFAWINIKPGNSRFARFLKENELARPDSYYGGVTVWVRYGDQSIELKEAYAGAFAKVLQEAGVRAYAQSRLD